MAPPIQPGHCGGALRRIRASAAPAQTGTQQYNASADGRLAPARAERLLRRPRTAAGLAFASHLLHCRGQAARLNPAVADPCPMRPRVVETQVPGSPRRMRAPSARRNGSPLLRPRGAASADQPDPGVFSLPVSGRAIGAPLIRQRRGGSEFHRTRASWVRTRAGTQSSTTPLGTGTPAPARSERLLRPSENVAIL